MKRRFFVAALLPTALAACASQSEWASDEHVARMAYRDPGPAYLTLVTMINNRSGSGAHTGLVINASQRVVWDPAGTFKHPRIPERNDVIYGMNPEAFNVYKSAHARETYHVVMQTVQVSPEVAEKAFALARQMGPVGQTQCTTSTANLLRQLPGFGHIQTHLFPRKLMDQFAALPGVTTETLYENDSGDKKEAFGAAAAYVPKTF